MSSPAGMFTSRFGRCKRICDGANHCPALCSWGPDGKPGVAMVACISPHGKMQIQFSLASSYQTGRRVITNCWPPELVQFSWFGATREQFTLLVVWRISERMVISTLRLSAMR